MIPETIVNLNLPYSDKGYKKVRVFVPEHPEGETLPVIYMTDGQNLFEDTSVQFGCWYTREAVRAEQEASGNSAIIVGIHNDESPLQRTGELMPQSIGSIAFPDEIPEEARKMIVPTGEVFDDFVINTVMPAVESQFPVKKGRENTAFCGSSSGGLQSFFTVMSHPDLFSFGGCFSPVFLVYYPNEFESWLRSIIKDDKPFLYLYAGGTPGQEEALSGCTQAAYGILSSCYPKELLKLVIKPYQPHSESAWAAEFKDFLHLFLSISK